MKLQTVDRALSFLETVATSPKPLKIKDLASVMGLNITTCYHLMHTLQERGYILREDDDTLRIGDRAAVLYQGFLGQLAVDREQADIVKWLSTTTDETVYLSRLVPNGVVVQMVVEATQAVRVKGLYVGYRGWEHIRASGKAVLAFMPKTEQHDFLQGISLDGGSGRKAPDISLLDDQLESIRQQGWALDEEDFEAGVCCCAVPYFSAGGHVAGSISVSVPSDRYYRSFERLSSAAVEAGKQLSRVLGDQSISAGPNADTWR